MDESLEDDSHHERSATERTGETMKIAQQSVLGEEWSLNQIQKPRKTVTRFA